MEQRGWLSLGFLTPWDGQDKGEEGKGAASVYIGDWITQNKNMTPLQPHAQELNGINLT